MHDSRQFHVGTLNVSSAGAPQPRPQITLRLSSRKLAKVAKQGRLLVAITSSARADDASVTAKLGKETIVTNGTVAFGSPASAKGKLK